MQTIPNVDTGEQESPFSTRELLFSLGGAVLWVAIATVLVRFLPFF